MRFKIDYRSTEWMPWFAWAPCFIIENDIHYWVWLEWIERRWYSDSYDFELSGWSYRLPQGVMNGSPD